MKTKSHRLRTIRKVITRDKVSSQDELMKLLTDEGISLTQATLSRDLKYLGVGKMPDKTKGYVYVFPEQDGDTDGYIRRGTPLSGFISIDFARGMGLIKTRSGFAQSIATTIDSWNMPEIAGTIAGDDTVLVIPRDYVTKEEFLESLSQFIPEIPKIK